MPELPEVETIARALRTGGRGGDGLPGRKISSAQVLWPKTLAEPAADEFALRIAGQRIESVGRRGKFLVIRLQREYLLAHLRMSGDLRVEKQPALVKPHDRLILDLEDGGRVAFNDARKFGRVWLLNDPAHILGKLGPEPLDADFQPRVLFQKMQSLKRQIKPLLLDQQFIAGVGNIYADEALHLAGIHPLRRANQLSRGEVERLCDSIRSVLEEGIRRNGASFDWVYRGGDFQNSFRVYQHTGQPCPTCNAPVERIVVGQRGTHFCPVCQAMDAGAALDD